MMLGMTKYKRLAHATYNQAEKTQQQMHKLYGYYPSIFREVNKTGRIKFVVDKPQGLKRI